MRKLLGKLKLRLVGLWHLLIILSCAFGIAMFFKLGRGLHKVATTPDSDQSPWLWWLLFGLIVAAGIGLFVEAARRVRILVTRKQEPGLDK